MKRILASIAVLLLAACCSASLAVKRVPCDAKSSPRGWRTYVDRNHGFCFRYPSTYKRVPNALERDLVTFRLLRSDAQLIVWYDDKAFDLQGFVQSAPTGYDSPPKPVPVGQYTFYYYGPGGGGVEYPDQYFFNLRGKILCIEFDGPYVNDKTPSAETKKLESEILATFAVF